MKIVIFAGGIGTRISEESHLKPKPMIEIGHEPILWHIMKIYLAQGFNEFVICLGYKGHVIRDYFINYYLQHSDFTVDLTNNQIELHEPTLDRFKVTLVDTGLNTMTAGRLNRVRRYVDGDTFMLTYGDGVADIDLNQLAAHHRSHGKVCTLTAVRSERRFGELNLSAAGMVTAFEEKPGNKELWINGGFFVLEPTVFDYLKEDADRVMWEKQPLEDLTAAGELAGYQHRGFWRCMDALRDKVILEDFWASGKAPWKIW